MLWVAKTLDTHEQASLKGIRVISDTPPMMSHPWQNVCMLKVAKSLDTLQHKNTLHTLQTESLWHSVDTQWMHVWRVFANTHPLCVHTVQTTLSLWCVQCVDTCFKGLCQHPAPHCSTLQHTLQHTATRTATHHLPLATHYLPTSHWPSHDGTVHTCVQALCQHTAPQPLHACSSVCW